MQQLTPIIKNSKKSNSGVGTFVLCLILSFAVIFFLVLPKFQEYTQARDKANGAEKVVEDLKAKQSQVNLALDQMKQKQDELGKVSLAVPSKPGVPEVYAYLETMSKSLNLTLISMQAKDDADSKSDEVPVKGKNGAVAVVTPKSNSLGTITINMQLKGDFKDLINFLGKLQNSLRLIDVQSIDVTSDGKSLGFSMVLKTYYQNDK